MKQLRVFCHVTFSFDMMFCLPVLHWVVSIEQSLVNVQQHKSSCAVTCRLQVIKLVALRHLCSSLSQLQRALNPGLLLV